MGTGFHRDTTYLNLIDDGVPMYINNISVAVAQLKSDMQWWIIPDSADDNDLFSDIGPYADPEEAFAMYRLMACKEKT